MAAWRLVSGLGGLARERYRGETKTLCNVEKLPAEGRPSLAGLELPTAVVKSSRNRPRSTRSPRVASSPQAIFSSQPRTAKILYIAKIFSPHTRLPRLHRAPLDWPATCRADVKFVCEPFGQSCDQLLRPAPSPTGSLAKGAWRPCRSTSPAGSRESPSAVVTMQSRAESKTKR